MNTNKYFIIKADDLKYSHLSKNWVEFLTILNKYKIPAALGIIGHSLEADKGNEYNNMFKELISNHELFCHGYSHCLKEYIDQDFESQRISILKTIENIKKVLDYSSCTFGAPGNNISNTTKKALECVPIKIWLFGMEWKGINLVNQRNFRFEYSDSNKTRFKNRWLRHFEIEATYLLNKKLSGNCDSVELIKRYKNVMSNSLIIGQIHPALWNLKNLKELEKFLYFVNKEGEHQFITPKQLQEKQKIYE